VLAKLSAWIARIGAPAFRRVYRYDRALRRKLTPAGWLLAALAVVSMIFGLNTREVLLYQLFGLSVGLVVVAAFASLRLRVQFTARRRLPPRATAGVPFDYTLTLRLGGGTAPGAVWVEDLLALPPKAQTTGTAAFTAYKVHSDRSRNFFDRLVGYPRWVAFMRQRIGAHIAAVPLAEWSMHSDCTVKMRCEPLRRGLLQFEAVRIARNEPLGLMKAHAQRAVPDTLLVLPRTYAVAETRMAGSRRLQPGGVANSSRIGEAEEFVGLRDYRPGDTPRRIHWKAWARTGRPVVKEHQDEFFVRHALVLDTSGPTDAQTFEAAVSLAASLVALPRGDDSLLDLMFVEGRAYTLTQGRGLGAAAELLRVLAAVSHVPGSFAPLAEAVALGAARISSAICVLLAWDTPRQQLVASLRARGLPVRVWLVVEPEGRAVAELQGSAAPPPAHVRVVHAHNLAQELMRP
jgi:uncharacterized protein (DUF58 family)